MHAKPLRLDLLKYARSRGIQKKLNKQIVLFITNPRHPSLHTEILEPKSLMIYSFRINVKYRAIFIFITQNEIEIVDINNHYR